MILLSPNFVAPEDFLNTEVMLLLDESTSRVCADIPITNDNTTENPEEFEVVLVPEDDPTMRPSVNVSIIDDDSIIIGFELEAYSVQEDGGIVQVCAVIVSGRLSRAVVVSLETGDIDALGEYHK